jgi:hypothetical protein
VQFYAGIKQLQVAKIRGESIVWWKHYLIISAFMFGCFGILECWAGLYLNIKLVHDVLESGIGTLLGILFILFTLVYSWPWHLRNRPGGETN